MKNFVIIILILFFKSHLNAQHPTENFLSLKEAINNINPEVDFSNKLVFITVWKSSDSESRDLNKEAYRVYKIYENAKMKNGEKGTVFISLNLDTVAQNRILAVGKDSIDASTVYFAPELIKIIDLNFTSYSPKSTIVYDKTGAVQYSNIEKDDIFSSLRKLVTR